jgi:hypothetical protein
VKKRTYRIVPVGEVSAEALASKLGGGRVVFAIDVAKVDLVAAVAEEGVGHQSGNRSRKPSRMMCTRVRDSRSSRRLRVPDEP